MDSPLDECFMQFVTFKDAALSSIGDDGTVFPELYWPEFIKQMRYLKTRIADSIGGFVGTQVAVPMRKILTLVDRLEENYPCEIWDNFDLRNQPREKDIPADVLLLWSRPQRQDLSDIRRLYQELAAVIAETSPRDPSAIPIDPEAEFAELLAGIDLPNKRLKWREVVIDCPVKYLTFILELCKARIQGQERRTEKQLQAANSELDSVRFRDAASAKLDQRLIDLIQRPGKQHKEGFGLNLPSTVLELLQ